MNRTLLAALGGFCLVTTALHAQVPNLVNYQGRVAVGATNFNGTGQFKFALVQGTGPTLLWKNDGSTGNTEPAAGVPLTVTRGLYSVLLGDTSLGVAMTAIPASVWANADVRLRVWFNDGTTGFQLLTPDQRLAPSGYLPDASVGSSAIAASAVTSAKIASGAVTNTQLAAGAVQAGNIASGAVGATQIASTGIATGNLANGSVTAAKLGTDVGLWSVSGSNVFRGGGNVGIGTPTPQAKLHVGPTQTDFPFVLGTNFRVNAGNMGSTVGDDLPVASFAYSSAPGGNQVSLGIRARKIGGATEWYDTAVGLTMDVDNQIGVGGGIWFNNGKVGIGTTTPNAPLSLGTSLANTKLALWDFDPSLMMGLGIQAGQFRLHLASSGDRFAFLNGPTGTEVTTILGNGNVGIGTSTPQAKLHVNGISQMTSLELRAPGDTPYLDFSDNPSDDYNARIILTRSGGVPALNIVGAELYCTAINLTSDRNAKEQFKPVNAREVLDKVARLPISEWQYKTRDEARPETARHIGPMAQDFREAFALGQDEKHITSVDADGVALAAIQGLNEIVKEKDAELERLKAENQTLAGRLETIERMLNISNRDAANPSSVGK